MSIEIGIKVLDFFSIENAGLSLHKIAANKGLAHNTTK
jgi:DNA-binding IclR family transcriptional regulator